MRSDAVGKTRSQEHYFRNTNRFTHLEASAAQPVVEPLAVMSSLVGCQVWGHPAPHACWEVQLDSAGPNPSWGCRSRTV